MGPLGADPADEPSSQQAPRKLREASWPSELLSLESTRLRRPVRTHHDRPAKYPSSILPHRGGMLAAPATAEGSRRAGRLCRTDGHWCAACRCSIAVDTGG